MTDTLATDLANRFVLSPGQIQDALLTARDLHLLEGRNGAVLHTAELTEGARSQSDHSLGKLAVRVRFAHDWRDLVLAPATLRQIKDIVSAIRLRHHVYSDWGFSKRLVSGLFEDLWIVIVYLDLDWLGGPGQVADQIFECVRKLDVDRGFGRVDLAPELRRNVFERPLPVFLEPDQKVAGIRFGNRKGEPRTSAPGVTLHFRSFTQELLNMQEHAVALFERRSRGRGTLSVWAHWPDSSGIQRRR